VDDEASRGGGGDYGWLNREGAHNNVTSLPPAFTPLVDPIVEYSHALGNVITGGVVYRGTGLGVSFWGRYFFADFGARRIWSVGLTIDPVTREATAGLIVEHTGALGGSSVIGNVSAFGTGANCEVFFLNYSDGQLRRIVNTSSGAPAGCPTTEDPFLSSGGGVFVSGTWFSRDHPMAAGAGLAGMGTGSGFACTTVQPVSDWVCVNGGWVPPDHPLAASAPTSPPPPLPPPPPPSSTTCTTVQPVSTWVCVNGGWVPPDHPLAIGAAPAPPPPPPPPTSTGDCVGPNPFVGIPGLTGVCVNGNWVPSDHPLAGG
jgi:hypothetical protein